MEENLVKNVDIGKIAKEGEKIYEEIKSQYEPQQNGKFLAIEPESRRVYLGNESVDAVTLAKKDFPEKVFYLVKIGYGYTETLAKFSHKNK